MKGKFMRIIKNFVKLILPPKLLDGYRNIYADYTKRQKLKLISTLESLECTNSPRYIVSLTSYGKRLTETAPYAIITLLNQSIKPDKIVLWVGYDDKKNLPPIMEKLTAKGLEIHFCEDIRSYTKLIPALLEFPDEFIITADDDIDYPQNWFKQLKELHKKNPRKIICHGARRMKVDENHNLLSFNQWGHTVDKFECANPLGYTGVLYPPKCFYKEITNKELFLKLAPCADDIWFWAMAILNKSSFEAECPYVVISDSCFRSRPIDPILATETSLWSYNSQGGNDKQLRAVIEYFPEIREFLKKIKPK